MIVYAYLRVSSQEQADSGLGMAAQRSSIEREAEFRKWSSVEYHEDAGKSGASLERPALAALLDVISKGDVLVVSKLDRLSRSVIDTYLLLQRAQTEGWSVIILDLGLDLATPMGKAMAGMVAVFAELERDMGSQRTKEGLAEAKAKGVRLGRPSRLPEEVREGIAFRHEHGLSAQRIANELNELSIPTAGGGKWSRQQVSRIIRTL